MLPTGSDQLDNELMAAACKHGAAVEAAVHALQKKYIRVAMEVVSRVGPRGGRVKDIRECCVKCLAGDDVPCIVAALRCLVGIGEIKSIPIETIKKFVVSRNAAVRMAGHIAVGKMVQDGVVLTREMLDVFVAKADSLAIAGTVVVHACANEGLARAVVGEIASGNGWPLELVLRVLLQSVQHTALRSAITGIVQRVDAPNLDPKHARAVAALKNVIAQASS
jgi:hypothetical protein